MTVAPRLFDVAEDAPDVESALALLDALPTPPGDGLRLAPLTLRAANAIIAALHRHSEEVRGMKFATRALIGEQHVGIAIAGRPVSRILDDGLTVEILRVCTWTENKNVCSKLYGACCRAAAALGHVRAVTYTRADESGTSLRAAGFVEVDRRRAESWDCSSRPRDEDHHELSERARWERPL